MQQEQHQLAQDAANKTTQANGMSTGNPSAVAAAQEDAERAKTAYTQIQEAIASVQRQITASKGGDVPEYQGVSGAGRSISDAYNFMTTYGPNATYQDALKQLQQQLTPILVAMSQGRVASENSENEKKRKGDLLTQAGEENGQAQNLGDQIKTALAELADEQQTAIVTKAVAAATVVLGQMHTAESNNTPQGYKDAVAALRAGQASVAELQRAIITVGNTNMAAHSATVQALADQNAEIVKLSRRISKCPSIQNELNS